jgi:DNA invertase Pin-like site-specific DNA recombinase
MKGKKMAIIGYIRVSSNKQMLEHQEFEIKKFAKAQNIKIDKWVAGLIKRKKNIFFFLLMLP